MTQISRPVSRLDDWHPRLQRYLQDIRTVPFAYGTHDCGLFVAGAVQAMTGKDFAVDYRGRYTTLKGGLKALSKRRFADHVALLDATLFQVPPAFAALGDIAVIEAAGDIPALGLFEGQHIAVLRPDGLGFVAREAATQAYRVS
jgi:hypothetical protein